MDENRLSGSKVVDADGVLLTCYHGGYGDLQGIWRPLTHFGTLAAATHRMGDATREVGEGHVVLHAVHLRICNPLEVIDDPEEDPDNHIFDAVTKLTQNGVMDEKDTTAAYERYNALPLAERDWSGYLVDLAKLVSKCGYDGLVYRNAVEDEGSVSWVIFDHSQVEDVVLIPSLVP